MTGCLEKSPAPAASHYLRLSHRLFPLLCPAVQDNSVHFLLLCPRPVTGFLFAAFILLRLTQTLHLAAPYFIN